MTDNTEMVENDGYSGGVIGDDYPYSDAARDSFIDPWNFYVCECTSFCAHRLNKINNIGFHNHMGGVQWGHAKDWDDAARALGYTVDMNPAIGSIAYYEAGVACGNGYYAGSTGHVAWVAEVNGDTVIIEEYNGKPMPNDGVYSTRPINKYTPSGYIHIKDIQPTPDPEPIGEPLATGYTRAVPDGYYQIVSDLNSEFALDIQGYAANEISDGSKLQLFKNRNVNQDVFYLSYNTSDQFYRIKHVISGKYLDVKDANPRLKATVQAYYDKPNEAAQKWAIKHADGDEVNYWIEPKISGKSYRLDVFNGEIKKRDDGKQYGDIWMAYKNNTSAQKWRLVPYPNGTAKTIENGNYHIVANNNTNYGLNVAGTSGNFKNVTAASNLTNASQVFNVSFESSTNSYIIKQRNTKYYLEVENCGKTRNIGVATGDTNGNPDGNWKKWNIISYGSGWYGIVSRETGDHIYYNSRNNGNVLPVHTPDKIYADQYWKFVRAVDSVSISKTSATVNVGSNLTLTATVTPSAAANKSVTWSSSNTNIATVNSSGVVTPKAVGTTNITVKTADGGYTAACKVTVSGVNVTGVSLNKSTASIVAGKTETLTATVSPSNATNKSVTWTSSNTNVATVSNTGVVTARAQGTATITVKTVDGNKTATCKVTVNPAIISVTGVSLNKSSTNIIAGNTESLTATISPSNATNKNVTWTSSNSNVATVTSSGVVTARTEGTADITVKTADGGKSAVCRVSVVTPPKRVVEHYSPDGRVGVPYSFTFESDGTKPLTWEVLDLGSSSYEIPKGLTLSSSGVLSGIPEKAGAYQFYITVSNAYGKYGFYCKTAILGEKLSFSLDSLPKGKVGEYYDITIQPISDTPYYAYINIEGEDENSIGLRAVNGNGLRICGTPTKAGVFTVVCEGTNYDGHSEKRYDLVIEGNKPVTGVELNKSSTTIVAGNTEALRATVTPYDAADKKVTWTSSNTNVATVTADGLVTAKAEGTADIKVKTNDGGKTATCKVRVVTIPGITTSSLPNGRVGESYTISMTASGTTPITWSIISGNLPSGLILDPDGTIYGAPAAAGIYTFSVQAKNSYGSSPAKQLSINVNPSKPVPGPGGDETNGTDTIIVAGQRIDLKEVCFKNVHGSIDRYVVDDRRLASISKTVLSGTKEGKVTVTAQSKIGRNIYEDVAKCQVTILNRPKLKFSKQLTYVGQAINASDYFTTSDTNVLGATYWESTNPSVVEVTDPISGKLVAHKNGTANISAYFGDKGKNGTLKVSATISVKIPSFQKNEYSVQTGADLILAMKNVTKAQNPTWATENGSVATATAHLDSKGNPTGKVLIKGINYGDTTLIATIDGQKYRCVIHVTAPKISRTALSIKTGRTANLSLQKTKLKKNQIIWKSSNENVVKVDANGKVTGVASGEALIYTTAGGIKNECVVTVR